jgi:hypothetical protein
MSDVRRFVGIDVGVLDNRIAFVASRTRAWNIRTTEHSGPVDSPIEANVDVSIARDLERGNTFNRSELVDKFLRNFFRRLFQMACELEGNRQRKFAERTLFRLLDSDRDIGEAITNRDVTGYGLEEERF